MSAYEFDKSEAKIYFDYTQRTWSCWNFIKVFFD